LAVAEIFFQTHKSNLPAACRVHGGGFAGTIQAFVPADLCDAFCATMDAVFGAGECHVLMIRPYGAICVDRLANA
jgi:galactokinase